MVTYVGGGLLVLLGLLLLTGLWGELMIELPLLGRRDRVRDVTVTATPDTPVRPDDPGAVAARTAAGRAVHPTGAGPARSGRRPARARPQRLAPADQHAHRARAALPARAGRGAGLAAAAAAAEPDQGRPATSPTTRSWPRCSTPRASSTSSPRPGSPRSTCCCSSRCSAACCRGCGCTPGRCSARRRRRRGGCSGCPTSVVLRDGRHAGGGRGRGDAAAARLADGDPAGAGRGGDGGRREGLPEGDRQPALPRRAGGAARRHRGRQAVGLPGHRAGHRGPAGICNAVPLYDSFRPGRLVDGSGLAPFCIDAGRLQRDVRPGRDAVGVPRRHHVHAGRGRRRPQRYGRSTSRCGSTASGSTWSATASARVSRSARRTARSPRTSPRRSCRRTSTLLSEGAVKLLDEVRPQLALYGFFAPTAAAGATGRSDLGVVAAAGAGRRGRGLPRRPRAGQRQAAVGLQHRPAAGRQRRAQGGRHRDARPRASRRARRRHDDHLRRLPRVGDHPGQPRPGPAQRAAARPAAVVLGLLLSLAVRRRRVFLRITPAPGRQAVRTICGRLRRLWRTGAPGRDRPVVWSRSGGSPAPTPAASAPSSPASSSASATPQQGRKD